MKNVFALHAPISYDAIRTAQEHMLAAISQVDKESYSAFVFSTFDEKQEALQEAA